MALPARNPFIAYLLVHAAMLRDRQAVPAVAKPPGRAGHALELLADVVRDVPEDAERLLMLVALVRLPRLIRPTRPPTGPSQGSPAYRAKCATPVSPP
jgi:hypothetical protein